MSTTTKKLKQDKMIQEENEQKVEKKLKQKKKKKSHQNHHHILKKYTDNHTLIQKQEKKQRQRQKIQHNNKKDKNQDKHNINNKHQISQSNDLTSSKQQQQISKQQQHISRQQKQSIDPIQHQLSLLIFTQQLTPSIQACQLINSHLQQLTINLYQKMIMKTSLITESIELAKKQLLTPKQYFAINYTNKLLLIKELLTHNGQVKYNKWIQMIETEVDRVQNLILRCIDDVDIFNQVLTDLKKLNNQWEIKPKYIIANQPHIL